MLTRIYHFSLAHLSVANEPVTLMTTLTDALITHDITIIIIIIINNDSPSIVPMARVAVGIMLPLLFTSSNLAIRLASLFAGRFCFRWRSIRTFSPTCLQQNNTISGVIFNLSTRQVCNKRDESAGGVLQSRTVV